MGLMKLSKRIVIHIMNRDTKFFAAAFISIETPAAVWKTFVEHRVTIYIGFPGIITVDQGPQFRSGEFTGFLAMDGIKKRDAGVESDNALGE